MSVEVTSEQNLLRKKMLRRPWVVWASLGILALFTVLAFLFNLPARSTLVGGLLDNMDMAWAAQEQDELVVDMGRPAWVAVGDRVQQVQTQSLTVGDLLAQVNVPLYPLDRVKVNERSPAALEAVKAQPLEADTVTRVQLVSTVPFVLHQDGAQSVLYAAATTVGDALYEAGVTLYAGDQVQPDLEAPLVSGMQVYLVRSIPVTILADVHVKTRTRGEIVAEALAQEGIVLNGRDRTEIAPDAPLEAGQVISITRVVDEWLVESELVPYKTVWRADAELEIDSQRVDQAGHDGIRKKRFKITYENGYEVARVLEREWVEQEPITRLIVYGTKIVLREVETPEGIKQYWRKFRVLATSYTAATSGKTRDHPHFGITFLGWRARMGIIAVDPRVIPLTANMYVPGYGVGVAGDTGGAIQGRRIDLCYEEFNLVLWYRWVDVYLLTPVPPRNTINWMLPSWPVER